MVIPLECGRCCVVVWASVWKTIADNVTGGNGSDGPIWNMGIEQSSVFNSQCGQLSFGFCVYILYCGYEVGAG